MLSIADQLKHLREGAGFIRRPELRTLKLSGPDRIRFLNGMVTNDVAKLTPTKSLWATKTSLKSGLKSWDTSKILFESISLKYSIALVCCQTLF